MDGWLRALARDLKAESYRPRAVRQILMPKKQRGKFRPLGIPRLRDRVAQTTATMVLLPMFEVDLQRSIVDAIESFAARNRIEIEGRGRRGCSGAAELSQGCYRHVSHHYRHVLRHYQHLFVAFQLNLK